MSIMSPMDADTRELHLAWLAGCCDTAANRGVVLHCGRFTLGLHPDGVKREEGYNALIDWSKTGGEIVDDDAPGAKLIGEVGPLRALGALGCALLRSDAPKDSWSIGLRDLAEAAQESELDEQPGAPRDPNLKFGLMMRAVALLWLGAPGDRSTCQRPGDVGKADSGDIERLDMVVHLKPTEADHAELKAAQDRLAAERRLETTMRQIHRDRRSHMEHCRSLYCRECGMR